MIQWDVLAEIASKDKISRVRGEKENTTRWPLVYLALVQLSTKGSIFGLRILCIAAKPHTHTEYDVGRNINN